MFLKKPLTSMFLTMFFKTQNIRRMMHLTMLMAHPHLQGGPKKCCRTDFRETAVSPFLMFRFTITAMITEEQTEHWPITKLGSQVICCHLWKNAPSCGEQRILGQLLHIVLSPLCTGIQLVLQYSASNNQCPCPSADLPLP